MKRGFFRAHAMHGYTIVDCSESVLKENPGFYFKYLVFKIKLSSILYTNQDL